MNAWVTIYAIGAAQALLLALALWWRTSNPQANRILAVWLGIVGVDLAVKAFYLAAPGTDRFPAYWFVGLFPFLYGSLFYLYVRALTTARGLQWRDVVHLGGFAFILSLSTVQLARLPAGSWPSLGWWASSLMLVYSVSYVIAALVRIQRYRCGLLQRRSDADRMSLRWIVAMAVGQIVIWVIAGAQQVLRIPHVDYFLIYGAVAAWVCVVGWFSLGQPPVTDGVAEQGSEAPLGNTPNAADTNNCVESDNGDALCDDTRFPAVEARLSQLMVSDALYREPALTIGQVAKRSGYPEYLVSAVINRRLGGNFWEYINRHRIDAATACFADVNDSRSILEIAYACGFTSKSTFNAAFKRQVGQTPSVYRRQQASPAEGV